MNTFTVGYPPAFEGVLASFDARCKKRKQSRSEVVRVLIEGYCTVDDEMGPGFGRATPAAPKPGGPRPAPTVRPEEAEWAKVAPTVTPQGARIVKAPWES